MAGESAGRHVHRALNAGAGFGDDKGGTITFHPIGAVRAGVKGAVGTVGRRRRRRRRICAVPRIHRALFHDRVDVYFAGTGSTQYTVVPALALALVVAPTTDAGGVFFVAVATNIFLSKEKQKRKKKKYPENVKKQCRNKKYLHISRL